MHPLDVILDDWRRKGAEPLFSRTRAMGTAFEDLCAAFLTHDPRIGRTIRRCAPLRRLGA